MKPFIAVNYNMAVNQLTSIPMYWGCGRLLGIFGIQNIFIGTRYEEVLQNLHFPNNTKQDKTDKGYKIRPIIGHLNESFQGVF